MSVVDGLIRDSGAILQCFVDERARRGRLPSGVEVVFVILPSVSVVEAHVSGGYHVGSSLESFFKRALRTIDWPAFQGSAQKVEYRFNF